MTSMNLRAPFSVQIKGNQLVVTQAVEGVNRILCILYLDDGASFFFRDSKVVYLPRFGQEFSFDTSTNEDAYELLNQVVNAQFQRRDVLADANARHADELEDIHSQHAYALAEANSRHAEQLAAAKSRPAEQKGIPPVPFLAVVVVASVLVGFGLGSWLWPEKSSGVSVSLGQPSSSQTYRVPQPLKADMTPLPVLKAPPAVIQPVEPAPSPTASSEVPDDGWALPQAIRATLPSKLHNAAERKLFTVDYSSGHARTLYVFADPSCPNCKRLEPALNAISDAFNVVVFPVPVIGKEKSIAAITPVLCLPPEQRKAAWDALFDSAPDGLNLGKEQDKSEKQASEGADSKAAQPRECDVAHKALGINQVAYQAYLIPGTPWVISDDGRYVSQALLRDPLKLQAFLDEQPAQKGQEVSDASQ